MRPGFQEDHRPSIFGIGVVVVVCAIAAGGLFAVSLNSTLRGGPDLPTPSANSLVVASSAPAGATPAPASLPASSFRAVIDATLLGVLPATVGGLPVREFPDAEAQAVADPDLGRNVKRVATAFVGDAGGTNWAYTAIVDVRPEARTDAFYRDWQESFDASACEPAGGVTGHTTVVIAGHDVQRTACGGGVRTYHVKIVGTGLLVSISDLGEQKLGEAEVANFRP